MSTKSREVIFGSQIRGAKIHADGARQAARKAVREADRAEGGTMVDPDGGLRRTGQPSPTSGKSAKLRGGAFRGGPNGNMGVG